MSRRRVVNVEFTKKVKLRTGDPDPVQSLAAGTALSPFLGSKGQEKCPDMWLEGNYIVIGSRRFAVNGPVVESFDLEE